jgi:hypothetical protein
VSLSVHIEGTTEIDVKYFKVFENCDLVATVSTTSPDGVVKYDGSFQVVVPKDANIVVAGFGSKPMPKGLKQYDPAIIPRFLTNPIYVDVDGDGKFTPPGGKTCDYDLLPPK